MVRREINLWDYLVKELRKWKLIVVVAVICGALIAALGYIHSSRSYEVAVNSIELEYSDIDEQIDKLEEDMTDDSINNAVKYCDKERSLRSQEAYIDNSILMTLDGNNLHEANYVVSIEYQGNDNGSDRVADMAGNVASAFNSDDFLKTIRDELYPEKNASYVLELVNIEKTSNAQNISDAASTINLTIIIPNERDVADCDKVVNGYVSELNGSTGNYKIQVINSNEAYVSDVLIINKQRDTYNYVDSYRTKLATDKGNLASDEQKLADLLIAKERQEEGSANKKTKKEALDELAKPGVSKKYILAGIFLGIILVMGLDFVILIITTKTNTMEEICSYFSIKPLLVCYNNQDKGFLTNSKLIYNWQYKRYSDVDKQTDNYIRQMEVLNKDKGVKEIELITCHDLDDADMEYIEKLKESTEKAGIKLFEKEAEFIGKIDTSSQLRGDSPVMLYIRQNRTLLTRLSDVKVMADKNQREIVGFIYIDC